MKQSWNGVWMGERATVRDVAAETGLSIATVSRVLNGQANVARHTRELVLRAVDRLGAQAPRPRAGQPRSGAIYVRCPYLLTDYFGLIVSSVAETLALHGRQVVLSAAAPPTPSPSTRASPTSGSRAAARPSRTPPRTCSAAGRSAGPPATP